MTPLYNGRESHYKKMLDLQAKLRKSEEERIRLEERFNVLVQESRNRHQACISRLRIRYVEFLEEQRAREERNSRLLGSLNKVDSSLALMSAKTDRLNVLRKQYEAYLLRAYGKQAATSNNGSVTADSGLGSQRDAGALLLPATPRSTPADTPSNLEQAYFKRELVCSPYRRASPPMLQLLPARSSFSSGRELDFRGSRELETAPPVGSVKLFSPPPPPPTPLDRQDIFSSCSSTGPVWPTELRAAVTESTNWRDATSPLDAYINRVKVLHAEMVRSHESQPEAAEASDREAISADVLDEPEEQNTSGDLLNVSLSEPEEEEEEEKPPKPQQELGGFRLREARQAFASRRGSGISPTIVVDAAAAAAATVSQRFSAMPDLENPTKRDSQSIELALARLASLDEPRQLIQQNRRLLAATHESRVDATGSRDYSNNEYTDEEEEEEEEAEVAAAKDEEEEDEEHEEEEKIEEQEQEARSEIEGEGAGVEEEEEEEEEEELANDGIEDDYDHSVDIDSWMPDDVEERQLPQKEPPRDHFLVRSKLESIEEVEQDEEVPAVEPPLADSEEPAAVQQVKTEESETVAVEEQYPDHQQYYQEGGELTQEQLQYQQSYQYYEQQPGEQQDQQYQQQYQADPNAEQYANYDVNAQYAAYGDQQYAGQYAEYESNQPYQQYDLSQAYADPNQQQQQQQQQYDASQYQEYQQPATGEMAQDQYYQEQAYGYSEEVYGQESGEKAEEHQDELSERKASLQESFEEAASEKIGESTSRKASLADTSDKAAAAAAAATRTDAAYSNGRKKKDVIKSILDSDSDSFIERNLSNTESDFDFN